MAKWHTKKPGQESPSGHNGMGFGISFGMIIGTAIGYGTMPTIWAPTLAGMGMCLGMVFGAIYDHRQHDSGGQENDGQDVEKDPRAKLK